MIESIAEAVFRIDNETVVFKGRRPSAMSPKTLRALVAAGVVTASGPGRGYYSAPRKAVLKNGDRVIVPESGVLDLKLSDLGNPEQFLEA